MRGFLHTNEGRRLGSPWHAEQTSADHLVEWREDPCTHIYQDTSRAICHSTSAMQETFGFLHKLYASDSRLFGCQVQPSESGSWLVLSSHIRTSSTQTRRISALAVDHYSIVYTGVYANVFCNFFDDHRGPMRIRALKSLPNANTADFSHAARFLSSPSMATRDIEAQQCLLFQ